ncbi:MAG: hypothetical protein QMD65_00915 [Patescibacteria group bacterium]|nr:hypothetical protein [Patescibacteria group bacterium]
MKGNIETSEFFSINKGDLLVIRIVGMSGKYIAEVIRKYPLKLKVTEAGPFAKLIQKDLKLNKLLHEAVVSGKPLISGLKCLGVIDNKLHEILPFEN